MAHQVGALVLPSPAAGTTESLGDPGLDVLGAYFERILETYLSVAWIAAAPAEPVVRVLAKDNPEERDFSENDLPLLCVWRQEVTGPNRSAESFDESVETLHILWVPAPTTQIKGVRRSPFFNAFKDAIRLAVLHHRDPSYVHAVDAFNSIVVQTGTGPFLILTGQPNQDIIGRIEITTSGAIGISLFRWSIDGGATWVASGVPTALTVPLGTTGLSALFAIGAHVALTTHDWTSTVDEPAIVYGSDVLDLAGLDEWRLRRFQRVPVDVPTGGDTLSYPAYLATLEITESTDSDWTNAAWGTEPTVIRFDLTTGGVDPLTTNQAKVPAEPDPP